VTGVATLYVFHRDDFAGNAKDADTALYVNVGTSRFRRHDPETGKREVLRCCALMENWTPGQRPLLR
jgi:hypothetical protein